MKRGEVWWVEFDPVMGSESRKTRPAVIISNDAANRNLPRAMAVALTSNTERVYPGHALVSVGSTCPPITTRRDNGLNEVHVPGAPHNRFSKRRTTCLNQTLNMRPP